MFDSRLQASACRWPGGRTDGGGAYHNPSGLHWERSVGAGRSRHFKPTPARKANRAAFFRSREMPESAPHGKRFLAKNRKILSRVCRTTNRKQSFSESASRRCYTAI